MIEWIVTSSVLITITLLLRLLLKKKLSGWLRYLLWLPVLLRLLIPLSIPSVLSVMNLMPETQSIQPPEKPQVTMIPEATATTQLPSLLPSVTPKPQISVTPTIPQKTPQPTPVQTAIPKETIQPVHILAAIWIGGMMITGSVLVACNCRFAKQLLRSRKPSNISNSPLPVYITHSVATPCLFGLMRPAIYIPVTLNEPKTLEYALVHEQTHYQHRDHIWSALRCVCLALHWYNPLVWAAAVLSKQDAELACDAAVIQKLGEEHRANYGKTLIQMACIHQDQVGLMTASTTMLTTKKSLKERIRMIARKPKTAIITITCVLLIAIIAVSCTFTGAEESTPPSQSANSIQFHSDGNTYVRHNGGFGGDFTITLFENGTYKYYEGNFSSYFGIGNWTLEEDILTLKDDHQNVEFINRFRIDEDGLTWIATGSTGFTYGNYISMADGDVFFLQSPKPAQLSYMADVCYLPQDYMDGGPLGCFLHVDGITYVWDHNVTGTLQDMQTEEIGSVAHRDDTVIPETQLAACRIPEGTVLYKGKDAGKSQYEAIYYKLEGFSLYARLLPIEAYRGTERWWENAVIHDGSETLSTSSLRQLQEEKGKLLSRTDLAQYSHVVLTGSMNGYEYRLFQVDTDYRLLLVSAATVTDVEALQARFYHKDIPNYWVDLMNTNIDTYQTNLTANEMDVISETETVFDLEGFVTLESVNNNTPCRILLEKNHIDSRHLNTQLVINSLTVTLREIISTEIGPMIPDGEILYLADVDGDRVCEIILNEDLGGIGGYGSFRCRVFKVEDKQITTLFDTEGNNIDTGFYWEICSNYKFVVHNRITGNSWELDANDYMKSRYFDETGKVVDYPLEIDSFYEFCPKDVDGDGIYELCTTQYTFAGSHVDGVGDAKCVFKYNKASGSFRIIETDFVQYTE